MPDKRHRRERALLDLLAPPSGDRQQERGGTRALVEGLELGRLLEDHLRERSKVSVARHLLATPPSLAASPPICGYLIDAIRAARSGSRTRTARLAALSCHVHLARPSAQRVALHLATVHTHSPKLSVAVAAVRVAAACESIPGDAEAVLLESVAIEGEVGAWATFFLMSGPYQSARTIALAEQAARGEDRLLAEYAQEKLASLDDV